jgi:hypothetical protein
MTTIDIRNSTAMRPKVKQHQHVILVLVGVVFVLLIAAFAFTPAKDDVLPDNRAWLVGP